MIWQSLDIIFHVALLAGMLAAIWGLIFCTLAACDWLEDRTADSREELELQRLQGVDAISRQMRETSYRLLAAAIDAESGRFEVVDVEELGDPESD
jgi:hypothetical protein